MNQRLKTTGFKFQNPPFFKIQTFTVKCLALLFKPQFFFLFSFLVFIFSFRDIFPQQDSSDNYEIEFISAGTSSGKTSSRMLSSDYFVIGEGFCLPLKIMSDNLIIDFGWGYYWPQHLGEVVYEIADLRARTELAGEEIPEAVWQKDNDPYFYWTILLSPPTLIKGFSFSLDELPDKEVDTEFAFYQYPEDSISDGKHIFYVAPYAGGESWGKALSFEIWVDTTPPSLSEFNPPAGRILSQNLIEISCKIKDSFSGVNPDSLHFYLNGNEVRGEFKGDKDTYSYQAKLPEGENTVLVRVEDKAGNQANQAWSFIVDTQPPSGSIVINNDDPITNSAYVSLKINASDEVSGLRYMYISNDGIFDTEMKNPLDFSPLITDWLLAEPDVSGRKTVYVKFEDYAGNISKAFSDEIDLVVLAPDTRIISGPPSLTSQRSATFYYQASRQNCLFSYSLDGADWSIWQSKDNVSFSELSLGVHLFKVKAGLDLNGDGVISRDEEDPTPAQWSWTVREETLIERFQKILFFRRE